MTIRYTDRLPFVDRIPCEGTAAGFHDGTRSTSGFNDVGNLSHVSINTEFNSYNQAANSLTLNFLPIYCRHMSWNKRLLDSLELKGWTKAELQRRSGVPYDNILKYLAGKVDQPRGDILAKLAEALEVDALWLEKGVDHLSQTKHVRLIGYIGAGQAVYPIDDGADDEVEAPADAHPSTVAARVRGESMLPMFQEGWIIYWSRHLPAGEMVNQLCVVQLSDGRIMVKTLRSGSQPGLWLLTSFNAADIVDVPVEWAAPIDWIKPK